MAERTRGRVGAVAKRLSIVKYSWWSGAASTFFGDLFDLIILTYFSESLQLAGGDDIIHLHS